MRKHTWYGADGTGFSITASDLLDLEPAALFTERRAMERMGPVRLGLYLIVRTALLSKNESRFRRWLWRHVRNGLVA